MVPGADFNCFSVKFWAVFREFSGAENEKRGKPQGGKPPWPPSSLETVVLVERRFYVWSTLVESRIHKRWMVQGKWVGWSWHPVQNAKVCWKSSFLEGVWFSHPRSEWRMWIGVGKLIQERTRISDRNPSVKQQSANEGRCYQMDNLDSCMPRGSNDYEVNQLLCGKGIPWEDEGLEREVFIKACLANYNHIS